MHDVASSTEAPGAVDLGSVAILPGLVNAHTHLELSGLRGQVPPTRTMPEWVGDLMARRRAHDEGSTIAIERAVVEADAAGTAVVGDVTNSLETVGPLATSRLATRLFYELIGFAPRDARGRATAARARLQALAPAPGLRTSLAAHAPYSVSPALLSAIGVDGAAKPPCAVHLAESVAEIEFLQRGTGPWRQLLERLEVWDPEWMVPECDPVDYLERVGLLVPGLLVAHGVQLTAGGMAKLAAAGAALVTCPRSNAWTGAGVPPIERFYRAGLAVAVGTDSLASCPDLNLFAELAELRRLAPSVPANALLESATRQGARALGFDDEFGTIEPGKRARLLVVSIPESVVDVEEYLVGGIEPDQVVWLEDVADPSAPDASSGSPC